MYPLPFAKPCSVLCYWLKISEAGLDGLVGVCLFILTTKYLPNSKLHQTCRNNNECHGPNWQIDTYCSPFAAIDRHGTEYKSRLVSNTLANFQPSRQVMQIIIAYSVQASLWTCCSIDMLPHNATLGGWYCHFRPVVRNKLRKTCRNRPHMGVTIPEAESQGG